ncbi:MAG: LPS-assembly protein LptD [Porticoccaceae bacterium]|nr:LPS-assembly protein LptD [Porticoccaceae bacterium]
MTILICAALPLLAMAEQDSEQTLWSCGGDPDGKWLCREQDPQSSVIAKGNRPARSINNTQPADPEEPRVARVLNLDWVKEEDMTSEQRLSLDPYCCGAYVEPRRDYPDADVDPDQASLRVNANTTEALEGNIAQLDGDVQISQGFRQVRSDTARINQNNRQVTLEGNVRFREPGLLLLGNNAKIDIDSKEVHIDDATYVLHEASIRGSAESLSRTKDGIIVIDDASYSSCEPGDTTWQLMTSEIEIDQSSGFAAVKNARLEVKDVPIFYFPYLKFPVDDRRSSGLLFPTISVTKDNGIDFTQPVYWNIAPNYDATISPRYIQERGFGVETEFRHLSRWSETELVANFLGDDEGGNDDDRIDVQTGLHPFEGENRYLLSLQHRGGDDRPWSTFLDLNEVSDVDYFRDLGNFTPDENSLTHLQRRASAGYKTKHWNYLVETQDYQVITKGLTDQYSVVPRVSIDGYYRFDNSLVVELNNRYSIFEHEDPNFVTGSRSLIDYSITWDKRWSWGYFKPKVAFNHLAYSLEANNSTLANEAPSATVPVYSVDSSVFLERDVSWLANHKQTFEPRLFYINAKFEDQSAIPDFDTREFTASYDLLFSDNRFNGGDRISDEERLTVAFTTRFIDQSSGQERFRASIAQSIYYRDRLVTLSSNPTTDELAELTRNQSPLALELAARLATNWRFTGDLIYDNHDNDLEKSSLGVRYNDRDNRLFNFTYRFTRRDPRLFNGMDVDQDIEQVDISAFVPVAGNFNLVGRWNHDFTNKRELELFAGFEYNSCCWRASLVARHWLDREDEFPLPEEQLESRNGIFLQIQFKGLAGTGSRVDTMLNNGIYGYEPLENF